MDEFGIILLVTTYPMCDKTELGGTFRLNRPMGNPQTIGETHLLIAARRLLGALVVSIKRDRPLHGMLVVGTT